jgi:2,4-dienoyl-CoA reductase-like NADH-dependent reductase (Old Yellow Enzyme family)
VAIRLSPYNNFQLPEGHPNPVKDFTWVLEQIDKLGLAFVTIMQPRSDMILSASERLALVYEEARARGVPEDQLEWEVSVQPFRKALKQTVMFASGRFDASNWIEPIETGVLDGAVFGRQFISNPDLVERLRNGWSLAPWNGKTFYTPGPVGYVDYPVWEGESTDPEDLVGAVTQSLKL